jgi:phosphopantetheinyl transferase (holo-ACP synthase)
MAGKKALAVEHLLRPVRFRQLIQNLYEDGFRAFIQVGTGSLVGFVNDTLKSKPHLAIAANVPARSGIQQLQHVCAALWVEGAQFDRSFLGLETRAARAPGRANPQRLSLGVPLIKLSSPPLLSVAQPAEEWTAEGLADPLQAMFADVLTDIRQAGHDVLALWRQRQQSRAVVQTSEAPAFSVRIRRHLDIATTIPMVRDHSFHRERDGWPELADLRPVVPLTMEIELLREALEAQVPGHKVIEFEAIEAFRWLVVAEPVDVTIHLSMREYPSVEVGIEGFIRGRAVLGQRYPEPPAQDNAPLRNARACSISANELYSQNWMFHLEAYRGVTRLGPVGDDGIRGSIKVPPGPGALLDNMGQLAGFWVMQTQSYAPLAMPIAIRRVRFFQPHPPVNEEFECNIRIEELDEHNCWSNQQLIDRAGRVCVEMLGWHTRRFQMTAEFFRRVREVETRLLSEDLGRGVVLFEDRYDTANMREYIALRVLNQPELREYEALPPRRKREWLNGRVAAKDAVRKYLWEQGGHRPLFPKELAIQSSPSGAPVVRPHISAPYAGTVHVSISHKSLLAAAIAASHPVGIDVETIEPRPDSFLTVAFSDTELALLARGEPEEWYARGWAAKEAVSKAAGTGLQANPRAFRIEAVEGSRLRVNGTWVETLKHGSAVIAYTGEEL